MQQFTGDINDSMTLEWSAPGLPPSRASGFQYDLIDSIRTTKTRIVASGQNLRIRESNTDSALSATHVHIPTFL